MKRENENIHIFIIEEEYRRSKTKQHIPNDFLRKAEPLILNKQSHESTIMELKKMHSNFEVNQEQETIRATEEIKYKDPLQTADSSNSISNLDFLASLEKKKTATNNLKIEILELILSSSSNGNRISITVTVADSN